MSLLAQPPINFEDNKKKTVWNLQSHSEEKLDNFMFSKINVKAVDVAVHFHKN